MEYSSQSSSERQRPAKSVATSWNTNSTYNSRGRGTRVSGSSRQSFPVGPPDRRSGLQSGGLRYPAATSGPAYHPRQSNAGGWDRGRNRYTLPEAGHGRHVQTKSSGGRGRGRGRHYMMGQSSVVQSSPRVAVQDYARGAPSAPISDQYAFQFVTQGRPMLPTKSSPRSTLLFPEDPTPPARSRKRDMYDIGARSAPRRTTHTMTTSKRAEFSARKTELTGSLPTSKVVSRHRSGYYLSQGEIHAVSDADDEDDGDEEVDNSDDEIIEMGSFHSSGKSNRARKAARKLELSTKRATLLDRFARKDAQIGQKSTQRGTGPRIANTGVAPNQIPEVIELSDSDEEPPKASDSDEDDDVAELMGALDAFTLGTRRLRNYGRLPFLIRNLRQGFKECCVNAEVPILPNQVPAIPALVIYRYKLENDSGAEETRTNGEHWTECRGSMIAWKCPLCDLHGKFNTREMLAFHLQSDHGDVNISWQSEKEKEWTITLVIPQPRAPIDGRIEDEDEEEEEEEAEQQQQQEEEEVQPTRNVHPLIPEVDRPLTPSSTNEVSGPVAHSPEIPADLILEPAPLSPIQIKSKFRAYSPPPRPSAPAISRSSTVLRSVRGSLPARYPTPPPPSDPLGPAAQYPYLSPVAADGEVPYSCRPGGPRLFDLLNTLPLEPYGVLSWMIVDREEEIYELNDVRDEDKVILALWNRWIMLNRVKFVFEGYMKGVTEFIDEYWQTIHQAAGWGALRAFLLMLTMNRFLTISEVAKLLKHYETKTGMEYWYKDDPVE